MLFVFTIFFYIGFIFFPGDGYKKSRFFRFLARVYSRTIYPFFVVLGYPVFQILLHKLFCTNKMDYYKNSCELNTKNYIESGISIFLLILIPLMFLLIGMFYLSPDPFVDMPISRPIRINFLKGLFLKFFNPLIYQILPEELKYFSLIVTLAILSVEEVHSIFVPCSYKKDIIEFFIFLNSFQIWISISGIVNLVSKFFNENRFLIKGKQTLILFGTQCLVSRYGIY